MRGIAILSLVAFSACVSSSGPGSAPADSPQPVHVIGAGAGTPTTQLKTMPSRRPVVANVIVPLDDAWRLLPAVYTSLGLEITRIDSVNHIVGNAGFRVRGRLGKMPLHRYIDCGSTQGGPNAETYEVHMSVVTQVEPGTKAGVTAVSTLVEATARPVTFSGEFSTCVSTGSLEGKISSALEPTVAK